MDIGPEPKGWSDVGVLAQGVFDESLLDEARSSTYLMDLDKAKNRPDGVTEAHAFARYVPLWQLLRFDDKTMTKDAALLSYKWFLWATRKKAKAIKSTTGQNATHVDMTGGNFYITADATDTQSVQLRNGTTHKLVLNEETFLKL
jgi:hypothetical protein